MFQGHDRPIRQCSSYVPEHISIPSAAGAESGFLKLLVGAVALWLLVETTGPATAFDCEISDAQDSQNGDCIVDIDGGDSLTITETGSIETANDGDHAVLATDGNNTVTNRGGIATSGNTANGVEVTGGNNDVITNLGNISTSGTASIGISARGRTITITNSGTIRTENDQAHGIFSIAPGANGNHKVSNQGGIVLTGDDSRGISVNARDSTIDNTGNIDATGENAWGIFVNRDDNIVTNWGDIRAANGIHAGSNGIVVTNWGSITALQDWGIEIDQGGNTVVNWGDIQSLSEGIRAADGDNTVINWGRISSVDFGIHARGGNNTVTNGGWLVSEQDYAIRFFNANNTLNLQAPGYIGGGIHLSDGTIVNFTTGPSHSVLWNFEGGTDGAPTISGPYAGFYNEDTLQYATFDPTALAGTVNQFGHMQGLLSGIGRSGLTRTESAPVQVADSTGETASDAGGVLPWDGRVWASAFGGLYDHDGDEGTLDRDIDLLGFAAGYSARPVAGLTVSAMAGYLRGSQDADAKYAPSYRLDSTGIFAGANTRMDFGLFDLDFGLTGGRVSYDSDRFINDNLAPSGASWATASFDGWFVIPEVGVSTTFEWTDIITVRPSARVSYAYQRIGSYEESGSNGDARVDGRTLSLLTGTAELAFEKQLFDIVTVNAVGGYEKRLNVGDDAVSMQLINVTNEVEFGDTDSAAFYAGGGVSVDIGDHISLALEARTYLNGDFKGTEGHARISIAF